MYKERRRKEPYGRRSDVFALGAMMYELITKQEHNLGESIDSQEQATLAIVKQQLMASACPESISSLILVMIAKNTDKRPLMPKVVETLEKIIFPPKGFRIALLGCSDVGKSTFLKHLQHRHFYGKSMRIMIT